MNCPSDQVPTRSGSRAVLVLVLYILLVIILGTFN